MLITAQEVVAMAFTPADRVRPSQITDFAILSAQRKFIKPVLGGLYDALMLNRYSQLLDRFVKPALAMYVKRLMLPSLSARVTPEGVTVHTSEYSHSADTQALRALLRSVESDARTLMLRAVDAVESAPEEYPEYNPDDNILNSRTLGCGILL